VKVQDLHYGDVLYYFYQDDHFDALVRLAAYRDQGRLTAHARDAELLRGGLYLSLGQHREAAKSGVLADPSRRRLPRQGLVLSRKGALRGRPVRGIGKALRSSSGTLSMNSLRLLLAQGLMYRGAMTRPSTSSGGKASLAAIGNSTPWRSYAWDRRTGLALLDSVGQIVTEWPD
jgi:hypothetical protein